MLRRVSIPGRRGQVPGSKAYVFSVIWYAFSMILQMSDNGLKEDRRNEKRFAVNL